MVDEFVLTILIAATIAVLFAAGFLAVDRSRAHLAADVTPAHRPDAAPRRAVQRFIGNENIRLYRDLLERTTDETERRRILKLLEEAQRKQSEAGDAPGES